MCAVDLVPLYACAFTGFGACRPLRLAPLILLSHPLQPFRCRKVLRRSAGRPCLYRCDAGKRSWSHKEQGAPPRPRHPSSVPDLGSRGTDHPKQARSRVGTITASGRIYSSARVCPSLRGPSPARPRRSPTWRQGSRYLSAGSARQPLAESAHLGKGRRSLLYSCASVPEHLHPSAQLMQRDR